jgi:hypothetical protein
MPWPLLKIRFIFHTSGVHLPIESIQAFFPWRTIPNMSKELEGFRHEILEIGQLSAPRLLEEED